MFRKKKDEILIFSGFARSLSKYTITAEKLLDVATDMLTNTSYKRAVAKARDFYLDRPIRSLDEAVFWANRAIRTQFRKPTFKRKGMYLSSFWYFYSLEVTLLIFLVFFAV